ncbi:unnamed protein product [Anisakis simplex]|uniref:Uncharacterized protein n=1 Tax=Anisakis simplex TaxID=6269 RepID=A0A0M3KKH7_ANISI|nr:unnamed protein product [Anisakis simplex]
MQCFYWVLAALLVGEVTCQKGMSLDEKVRTLQVGD